ncbi:hypothetical protein VB716_12730 [Synechococcus sp. CCY9201]|uniref:hypothetical protein n=1 Tax=Synechococcus sp. CCY9201 TaxID=174697 RepID=UPI002B21EB10|nr:hypothetical protein [Synechococcus sp. CCY9201]MEA5475085.1 hypothetical protein [Synechococcus sp. CCY9201]
MKTDLNVRTDTDQPRRSADGELSEGQTMQRSSSQAVLSRYRLIDSGCEPHRQLDGQYGSLDEAIADAIAWVDPWPMPTMPPSRSGWMWPPAMATGAPASCPQRCSAPCSASSLAEPADL